MLADFMSEMDGCWQAGMQTEDVVCTVCPFGAVPVAVPVLLRCPRSTSAWVVV